MSTQVKNKKQQRSQKFAFILTLTSLAIMLLFFVIPSVALANDTFAEGDTEDLYENLNSLLTIFIALGGFWTVGCVIFAGMRLSGAQGNPNKRTEGIIGLVFAILGGYVVYKCLSIVGWITGI